MSRRLGRLSTLARGISLTVWALCVLGHLWIVTHVRLLGDLGCEDPIGSSNYGLSSWHWWLPHTSCSHTAEDIRVTVRSPPMSRTLLPTAASTL